MRKIDVNNLTEIVSQLCAQANIRLRADVLGALRQAGQREKNPKSKRVLDWIITNAQIAQKEKLAICQDTGLPIVFLQVGANVQFRGGDLHKAVQKGIEQGYRKAKLRNSIIKDPLNRGKPRFSPAIVHIDLIKGSRLKITVLPKGFGCENKSRLKMFNPTAGIKQIKDFIIDSVKLAGPNACPPFVVGVGMGGTADFASFLAKKALLRKIQNRRFKTQNKSRLFNSTVAKLEKNLLADINKLNIGPMGLGGRTTALAVNIETYPTHIAGLPVAVNISCHALRSATKTV